MRKESVTRAGAWARLEARLAISVARAAVLLVGAAVAWGSARVLSRPVAPAVAASATTDRGERHATATQLLSAQVPLASASARGDLAGSPETTRLEQRRLLYETVDALLQASEFERARKLLDEDQERDADELAPEASDLAQGYRLIADCLERPNAMHHTRGQAFLLVNEATTLNAKLRAACAPD